MEEKRARQRNRDDTIEASVTTVYDSGPFGPYFVARAEGLQGSITCSLLPEVWIEERHPKADEIVILGDITKTSGGLRANRARFWRISDHT